MGFFSDLFRFSETSYAATQRSLLDIASFTPDTSRGYLREGCEFKTSNGQTFSAGIFSMPSVGQLRDCVNTNKDLLGTSFSSGGQVEQIFVKNIVGEARSLHQDYKGAVIQAASQFNFLEFPSSSVTPEAGIEGYIYDGTQGPACAVACGAGTAYRNYLVPVPFNAAVMNEIESSSQSERSSKAEKPKSEGKSLSEDGEENNQKTHLDAECVPADDPDGTLSSKTLQSIDLGSNKKRGQSEGMQLNGLHGVELYLESHLKQVPWKVKNGYIDSSRDELKDLNDLLSAKSQVRDEIISNLCIGIQEDTTITDGLVEAESDMLVTQTYNSAISIGYPRLPIELWEPIAKTVLDATYEATLLVGLLKTIEARSKKSKPPVILLTKVGGGVFGNKHSWIRSAITRAIEKSKKYGIGLDIKIVHFGGVDDEYRSLESN